MSRYNLQEQLLRELHGFIAAEYGQLDTEAVDLILVSVLLPSIAPYFSTRRPHFILDTDWPSRDVSSAWFSLGGAAPAYALCNARLAKRKEDLLKEWVDKITLLDEPALFVESEWRSTSPLGRGNGSFNRMETVFSYKVLAARSLRLRVTHAKATAGLCTEPEARSQRLKDLAGRLIDNASIRGFPLAAKPELPKSFLYWCELLQKLNRDLSDWETLTSGLACLAPRLAILRGRDEITGEDWSAVRRVMRDSVSYATKTIIEEVRRSGQKGTYAKTISMKHAMNEAWILKESKRLKEERVILGSGRLLRGGHADFYELAMGTAAVL